MRNTDNNTRIKLNNLSMLSRQYEAIKKYARKCRYCYLSMLTL